MWYELEIHWCRVCARCVRGLRRTRLRRFKSHLLYNYILTCGVRTPFTIQSFNETVHFILSVPSVHCPLQQFKRCVLKTRFNIAREFNAMHCRSATIICALIVLMTNGLATARSLEPRSEYHAEVARRLVHKSNWTSMGTLATCKHFVGFPMVNIISVADSATGNKSTGHIYYLLTDLDFTGKDWRKDNKMTALFTDDQDSSCSRKFIDPMEPTCARVIISGHNKVLNEASDEYRFAEAAFTNRHPASVHWRKSHTFYLCELIIEKIALLDFYGGPKFIEPEDYYAADFDDENDLSEYDESNDVIPSVISPKLWWWVVSSDSCRFRTEQKKKRIKIDFDGKWAGG